MALRLPREQMNDSVSVPGHQMNRSFHFQAQMERMKYAACSWLQKILNFTLYTVTKQEEEEEQDDDDICSYPRADSKLAADNTTYQQRY